MTVSPQWPQDGKRHPGVDGSGLESEDSLDSPTLPPTLFELPNLNQEARGQAQTDQQPVNQTPLTEAPAHQTAQGSPNSDDEPRSPMPPAVSSNNVSTPVSAARASTAVPNAANSPEHARAPERYPIPHNQPAGRSWMERIGSHSVVVVLLLVVIAAGLVIGRNSRNQGIDSSLADSSDLLDFDEGTELDLPLPKHVYNQPTNIATTAKAELSAQSQESRVSGLESFDAPTRAIVASGVSTGLSREAAVDGASLAADIFADSAARLNDPSTDLPSTGLAVNGDADANRFEVNKVNDGSTNVDFVAASSRMPAETSLNALPTLDDLDDQAASGGALAMPNANTPAPQLSKTPDPIIDWRLYLPNQEPATADRNVPFTSN